MRKWSSFQILFEALKLHLSYRKTVATEWHWRKTIDMAELPTAPRLQIQSSATNAGRTELHQTGHRPEGCGYWQRRWDESWELGTRIEKYKQTRSIYWIFISTNIHKIHKIYPHEPVYIHAYPRISICWLYKYSIYSIKAACMCRQS